MIHPCTVDSGPVTWPAIAVHGGAGTYARLGDGGPAAAGLEAGLRAALDGALDAGWDRLVGGAGVRAAVIAAVVAMEDDGGFNAGRGSVTTTAGTVEMDAAVMDSEGRVGAVACITGHSPVRAAEAVLLAGDAVLLAGPGADAFARGAGVARLPPSAGAVGRGGQPASEEGTVGAVAVDADGRFAAASSTGGRSGQAPGRVGDTPLPGAGLWAGEEIAVTATGAGEAFMLAGFARLVAGGSSRGIPLPEAMASALDAVAAYSGTGGGIALGGDCTWVAAYTTPAMARGVRHGGGRRTVVLG